MNMYVNGELPRASGSSITGLVTGIVGLVLCWVPGVGLILGIIGTTFGAIGMRQSRVFGKGGFGMAVAGLVCGILAIIAFVVFLIAFGAGQ
jgi:hypothetical protein